MLLRPTAFDWHVIAHFVGRLTIGVGLAMLIPALTGLLYFEWNSALDFVFSSAISIAFGLLMVSVFRDTSDLTTAQGLVIVALGWIVAMIFGSIPLLLSGHYASPLDSLFDAMSALTTTGLILIQDLDHSSNALNMWRHLMTFIGGQGIVVVALSMLVRLSGSGGAFEMYSGEAREERVVPNVVRAARVIWMVTFSYLAVGTVALFIALWLSGIGPAKGITHALWLFMGSWDTAGHAPNSSNMLFYHSGMVEMVSAVLMVAGTLSFGVHYAIWNGNLRELRKNIEPATMFVTTLVLMTGAMVGLAAISAYPGAEALFRKGFFQMISAHTSTGYMNMYPAQLTQDWGALSLLALMIAMGLGGSTSSTAGGIKALRVGISFKAFIFEVRRLVSPESAVIVQKYHQFKTHILSDRLTRNSLLIFSAYLLTFFAGSAFGMLFGYSFEASLIESTSAASSNGISAGIVGPGMPWLLKIVYMTEMWLGRLEFLAVWAFFGFLLSAIRGK